MMDVTQFNVAELDIPNKNVDKQVEALDLNENLSHLIDSLSQNILLNIENDPTFKSDFKELNYNDLNVKTTIETTTSVDSVKKKKFFDRIGDAIKGDVDVQKEKKEVLMILEYGNKKTTGTIDDQMKSVVKMTADYYENELGKINRKFGQLANKNQNIILNTMNIQSMSGDVFSHYKETLVKQKNILSEKYSVQYNNNRMIRLYSLLGIILLLILLTIAVLYLTNVTYGIEKKLIKAKEKITDNLMLKNRIVSMISHDIRSPLNIILLYVKQALKQEKDPQKTAVFDSINYTVNSGLLLANRILDFSKNEGQDITVYRDEFNLHDEVNHIVKGFNELAKSKNNQLINLNKLEPSVVVFFDRSKLQRLYFNLLDNAVKYAESGDIEVLSEWQKEADGRYKFTLSIKDSGKGIPKDSLKNIYEPYKQVSSANINNQDFGVGLGLYLCKEITELYDGKISVRSKLNKGTTVSAFIYMKKK